MSNLAEIETERLIIRPFRMEDLPDVYQRVSNAEVTKYTGGVLTYEEARRLLTTKLSTAASPSPFGSRAIVLKSTQRNIGYCGLNPLIALVEGQPVEISYGLSRAHWDCGFATEAAKAMLDCGLRGLALPHIVAAIHPLNTRSLKVAWKLGLRFDRKVDWPKKGQVNVYQITRDEYERTLMARLAFRPTRVNVAPFSAAIRPSA